MTQTCRKYTISPKTHYQWRDKFDADGVEALTTPTHIPDPELLHLRKENERLKRLLGEKELIISVKDELLKKKRPSAPAALRGYRNDDSTAYPEPYHSFGVCLVCQYLLLASGRSSTHREAQSRANTNDAYCRYQRCSSR
jgi:hypothetical protein